MFTRNIFKAIYNHLLPATCVLCNAPSKRAIDLCIGCDTDLPRLTKACRKCAQPLSDLFAATASCGKCLQAALPFEQTITLFNYLAPVDYLITSLKFQNQLIYARLLGELLSEKLSQHYQNESLPECIIPVPLHRQRLRERGFNQALEIGRPITKKLKIPMDFTSCERVRVTVAQSDLPAKERYQNIKNAFQVNKTLQAKHVAILDDVVTTGYTVSELSKELKKAGVEKVDVWCCARTSL